MRRTHTPAGRFAAVLAAFIELAVLSPIPASPQSTAPLLQQSDLQYLGAFRGPALQDGPNSFSYGGMALAYNPANNSLFMVGHDQYQLSAELSIPTPVISSTVSGLPKGTLLQPFADATSGLVNVFGVPTKVGGQLVYNGKLYGTVYIYYDATNTQVQSDWVRPSTSLSSGTAQGLYQVGTLGAGFVSGWLVPVPSEWQAILGGSVLTGQCCIPITGRTSYGPSLSVFNLATLGVTTPAPAVPVLYYTIDHATLGPWNGNWTGNNWNGTSAIRGAVFPDGTRTVLFFGQQGIGKFCYGTGGATGGVCYDPDYSWQGTHGYPYVAEVWAYDANDLVAVKNGQKRPWDPVPYAAWQLALPFPSTEIGGATWDPTTRRIYLSQKGADATVPYAYSPVIHVFQVGRGASGSTPPAGPTNLRVQ